MIPIIEIFNSIQGEGLLAGKPSMFIRVSGCNLRCVFGNSCCDTPYASFHPEKAMFQNNDEMYKSIFEKLDELVEVDGMKYVVITGGEPLLYSKGLKDLIDKIRGHNPGCTHVTIETNGTRPPLEDNTHTYVDLYSVSPKLHSSVDVDCKMISKDEADFHDRIRINYDTLQKFYDFNVKNNLMTDTRFKFVYSCEDDVKEIIDIFNHLKTCNQYLNKFIYLMPAGMTEDQLNENRRKCVEACMENGWTYGDRLHITIWGDKRGV